LKVQELVTVPILVGATLLALCWPGRAAPLEVVPAGPCAFLPLTLAGAPAQPRLAEVNDFLYQLQNLDLTAIGQTAYDLVVMDYSSDGTAAGEFTPAEIAALKYSPGGEKIIFAYMSIGEAEDYRFYWQEGWTPGKPPWLDTENPDWPGNYKAGLAGHHLRLYGPASGRRLRRSLPGHHRRLRVLRGPGPGHRRAGDG